MQLQIIKSKYWYTVIVANLNWTVRMARIKRSKRADKRLKARQQHVLHGRRKNLLRNLKPTESRMTKDITLWNREMFFTHFQLVYVVFVFLLNKTLSI